MDKDEKFFTSKFIGNCGENLVEFLLTSSGYECFRLGMENHIISLKDKIKKEHTDTNQRIRTIPDIIALKDNKSYLIEVKWRKDFTNPLLFKYKEIECYRKYWNDAYLLIISTSKTKFTLIKISDITDEMDKGYNMVFGSSDWDFSKISKDFTKEFNINPEAIKTALPIINKLSELNFNKNNNIKEL